jgi:transposase
MLGMSESTRVDISAVDRTALERIARGRNTPQKIEIALRAKIVLLSGEGTATGEIMRRLDTTTPTITLWRGRYRSAGIPGLLKDAPRPGRKPQLSAATIAGVVELTLREQPADATHWSTRSMAAVAGISDTSVLRIWKAHGLQPHRVETFKLSRDPQFIEKLHDVVGLYVDPPKKALVFSVDEKSQIQALDRTQPGLPMKKGRAGTMTHDYKRNGTTTLFAGLNVLTGDVIGTCMPRHRHHEFLTFLRLIDRSTASDLDLHLIVDNYATHKHPAVERWLMRHPRVHMHFTPTSASWLNLVERFFGELTQKRLRRGVFRNVKELETAIDEYLARRNENPRPFVWTASVQTILDKIGRAKEALEALH